MNGVAPVHVFTHPCRQINEAVVVAVGPGRRNTAGAIVPMSVKEGDKVVLPDYGGTPVKLGEDECVGIFGRFGCLLAPLQPSGCWFTERMSCLACCQHEHCVFVASTVAPTDTVSCAWLLLDAVTSPGPL